MERAYLLSLIINFGILAALSCMLLKEDSADVL
jgi:hypothetical protein